MTAEMQSRAMMSRCSQVSLTPLCSIAFREDVECFQGSVKGFNFDYGCFDIVFADTLHDGVEVDVSFADGFVAVVAAVVVVKVDVDKGNGEELIKVAAFVCVTDVQTEECAVKEGEVFWFFEEEVAPVAHVLDEVGDAVLDGFGTYLRERGAKVLFGAFVFVFPGKVAGMDDYGSANFSGESEGVGDDFNGGTADGFENRGDVDAAGGGMDTVLEAVGFKESGVG